MFTKQGSNMFDPGRPKRRGCFCSMQNPSVEGASGEKLAWSWRSYVGWWENTLSSAAFECVDCTCACVGMCVVYVCKCVWGCMCDLLCCGICVHVCMDRCVDMCVCRHTYPCVHVCGVRGVLGVFLNCCLSYIYSLIGWLLLSVLRCMCILVFV